MGRRIYLGSVLLILLAAIVQLASAPGSAIGAEFEFCNNWLMWVSFETGSDEGIEGNLDDNFAWMVDQGYTHLRIFGIYPNGLHLFPSAILDANDYPTDPLFESVLPVLVSKGVEYGITINFDGWEVFAEANADTASAGVGFLTDTEIAGVVSEVLALGVELISEEQFGGSTLQAIQAATSAVGARHETTNVLWWHLTGYADEQLSSVFSYYTYDQTDLDTIWASTYPPANLGHLHIDLESAKYYGIPTAVAVGSFGQLEAENWKNILLFSQIQHLPGRFSIEEEDTDFMIWDPSFDFMDDIGTGILDLSPLHEDDRPIVNLVIDTSEIPGLGYIPAWEAGNVSVPAIVNTFTMSGFRVVATSNAYLPEAKAYYLLLAGGAGPGSCTLLPVYVMELLAGRKPVFVHPSYGIPDGNDCGSYGPLRELFGLPDGDTDTYLYGIPETVTFEGTNVRWGGVAMWIPPLVEGIECDDIDTSIAECVLSGTSGPYELALIVRNGMRFLVNSNVIHLDAAWIFSRLLGGPLRAPSTADIAVGDGYAAILAEYDTDIELGLPWTGLTRVRRYTAAGTLTGDSYTDIGGEYSAVLLRGELAILTPTTATAAGSSEVEGNSVVTSFGAHPNPFNSTAVIQYTLSRKTDVTIEVFDPRGARVREVNLPGMGPGRETWAWDGVSDTGSKVTSGVYFCRIRAEGSVCSCKIILMR